MMQNAPLNSFDKQHSSIFTNFGFCIAREISNRRGAALYELADQYGGRAAGKVVSSIDSGGSSSSAVLNEIKILEILAGRVGPRLLQYSSSAPFPAIVSEWISGQSSRSYLESSSHTRNGAPRKEALLNLFRGMCVEVAKLHDIGLVHGDLQPAHFMVSDSGDITLIDFGMTKAPLTVDLPAEGGMVHFNSPEVCLRQQAGTSVPVLDFVSEIYSLCAVFWFLYSGNVPIRYPANAAYADCLTSIINGNRAHWPDTADVENCQFIPELENVLNAGLQTSRDLRPQSARALLAMLDKISRE
jgi:serine/threonine protein kinase